MTPAARFEFILWCIYILFAFYFAAWSDWKNRKKPQPPPVDFQWPNRVRLEYTDAAGEVVADKWYVPE